MYSHLSSHANSIAVSTEDNGAKLGVIWKETVTSCPRGHHQSATTQEQEMVQQLLFLR